LVSARHPIMGCMGSSPSQIQYPEPAPAVEAGEAQQTQQVKIDHDGDGQADASVVVVGKGAQLPFVRFDKSAVPKQLRTGDPIFIEHLRSKCFFTSDGESVTAANEGYPGGDGVFSFELKKNSNPGVPLTDGDDVYVRHYESGKYLTALNDFEVLSFQDKKQVGDSAETQVFTLFKSGRPLGIRHVDEIFLQTWVSCYVEIDEGCSEKPCKNRRWQRGDPQTLRVHKKEVVEATTTDLARQMQFQCFDLDGNSAVTRGEMSFILQQVKPEFAEASVLDGMMNSMTGAPDGGGDFNAFKTWADGSNDEPTMQHAEALGNVAQRCHDCLREEACLIEVMATVPSDHVEAVKEAYAAITGGGDLAADIEKKTSEQNGYIFTNWWRHTMKQLLAKPVDLWCQALYDAMNGLGTDENTLTALVCTIPEKYRDAIHHTYHEKYGKTLLNHIDSETSFNYKKVLMNQAQHPAYARCSAIDRAMRGLGTDEHQLIRIICACDHKERQELKELYERHFGKSLVDTVASETSGDFKKSLMAMLTAESTEYDLDADCEAMKKAMDGFGTDEEALIKLICGKTSKQMEDINAEFEKKYAKSLLKRVESEVSGYFKGVLQGCIRHPMKQLAHSVHYCIKGFGTDDTGLITLLTHLPEYKRASLRTIYKREFGRDLIQDIKGDTSGDYKRALLSCVEPAPVVWANALKGAMKGMGTADALLINFMCIAKDAMGEVASAFQAENKKSLVKWIEGDCSGDYKKALVALAERNSTDKVEMLPVWWAQRCKDALDDVNTLKTLLATMPAVSLKRGSLIYESVYSENLGKSIEEKCKEGKGFSFFTDYWKVTQLRLLELPISMRVKALNDAMRGFGTDEYTLTALVCTIPENMHGEVCKLYKETYKKDLVAHIESETSFSYKKVLAYSAMPKIDSRCLQLKLAMDGWGTTESHIIKVLLFSSKKERELIIQRYEQLYNKDLIRRIESETSGNFQSMLVAILESSEIEQDENINYDQDCDNLKEAMDGIGTDEDAIIRIVAKKTPEQIETLKKRYQEMFGEDLFARIDSETWDCGTGMFLAGNFRATMLGFLRPPKIQLAHSVNACIKGWGTDDSGLILCLVHLSERQRKELRETYMREFGSSLEDAIIGDTSGDYKDALLACVRDPCDTYCRGLRSSMKGLGTSDNLLINWMCIAKDRMDEVREKWGEIFEGESLENWINGDCSGDYKDTLLRVARRECPKFIGNDTGATCSAPLSKRDAVKRFNITFNALCAMKKANPGKDLKIPEYAEQELGCAFLYYASKCAAAPNLDTQGVWIMTNDIGFPPEDDGPDLRATFRQWDGSGSGEVDWNDFVREMTTRVNDPNHYEADPLDEEARNC